MNNMDLQMILKNFWKKKSLIIVMFFIGLALGFSYSSLFIIPDYKTSVTFMLAKPGSQNNNSITSNDLNLNSQLINNYSELIKSDLIIKDVITRLDLNCALSDLKSRISVNVNSNSSFVELWVTYGDKEVAASIANTILDVFIEKAKEIYKMENIYVVDTAQVPIHPYNINLKKNMMTGGLIGLLLAAEIILLLNYLDNTIHNEHDIFKYFKLKTIVSLKKVNKNNSQSWLENIKLLRTNLQFINDKEEAKTVAFLSPSQHSGKSWIITYLSIVYHKANYNICVIDADMKNGILYNNLKVKQSLGLSELLKNEDKFDDFKYIKDKYIQQSEVGKISVISSGKMTNYSSELLASIRFKKLLDLLKKYYDIILIDTPSSNLLSDLVVISKLVSTNLIVVEENKTTIKEMNNLVNNLKNVDANIQGVIINKVDEKN